MKDETNKKIVGIKIIDPYAAAAAVDVYHVLRKIMTGDKVDVVCAMTQDLNRSCSVIVSGVNIKPTNLSLFRSAKRTSSRFIVHHQDSGVSTMEFVFNLIK